MAKTIEQSAADLEISSTRAQTASQKLHDFANGLPTQTVSTDSGTIPTLAKFIKDTDDYINTQIGDLANVIDTVKPVEVKADAVRAEVAAQDAADYLASAIQIAEDFDDMAALLDAVNAIDQRVTQDISDIQTVVNTAAGNSSTALQVANTADGKATQAAEDAAEALTIVRGDVSADNVPIDPIATLTADNVQEALEEIVSTIDTSLTQTVSGIQQSLTTLESTVNDNLNTAATDLETAVTDLETAVGTKLTKDQNLADLNNTTIARSNLGLGNSAIVNYAVSTGNPTGGADGDIWYKV